VTSVFKIRELYEIYKIRTNSFYRITSRIATFSNLHTS